MAFFSLISSIMEGFLQLVYPPQCVACRHIIHDRNALRIICTPCLEKVQPVPPDYIQEHILARLHPCFLDDLQVVFQFDNIIQTIIHQIKYQKADLLAKKFAAHAVQFVDTSFVPPDAVVIPVPLFLSREKERGFNQSQRIAEGFFLQSKNHIHPQLLKRTRATQTQTELNRDERMQNVSQAFKAMNTEKIKGQSIIIVDDVVTTGATLNECARELKSAGASKVYGLTLATPVLQKQGGLLQPA